MEVKTLTNRVLMGNYPLNATVTEGMDMLTLELASSNDMHLLIIRDKVTKVVQVVVTPKNMNPAVPSNFEVLFNA